MRKFYLLLLMLIGISVNAQYFQHLYGTNNDDRLHSGINTVVQGQGYFMAGENDFSCLMQNLTGIPASFTDVNGNVTGAPYFDREYLLTNKAGTGYLQAHDPQVFELDNGSGFGIIGRYVDPSSSATPNTGVFYMQLDPSGNPTATYSYPAVTSSGVSWDIVEIGAVRKAIYYADTIYTVGTARGSNGDVRHFVLKIDMYTGGIGWGWIYNLLHPIPFNKEAWGKDIIENPWFPSQIPWMDVMVVGKVFTNMFPPFTTSDGFIFHTDANTGAMPMIHPTFIYGNPPENDWFNSITVAHDSIYNPPGFVIGGGTDLYQQVDFYVPRVNALGHPMWISVFDYSLNPNTDNDCFDVIERIDSNGKYTYYAAGTAYNGFFGGSDVQVVKMDSMGRPIVPGGEFTYGGGGNDFGKAMDTYNNNGALPPDGLSTFGTWNSGGGIGGEDLYMVRSYYNGLSGCNEKFSKPIWNQGPPGHPPIVPDTVTHFDMDTLGNLFIMTTDLTLCFSNTIAGGSNAFVSKGNNADDNVKSKGMAGTMVLLVPNPTENGNNNKVDLKVDSDHAGEVNVTIYDMQGREYYKGKFNLAQGNNQLPIDLSTVKMASGMYSVVISDGTSSRSTLMMVK